MKAFKGYILRIKPDNMFIECSVNGYLHFIARDLFLNSDVKLKVRNTFLLSAKNKQLVVLKDTSKDYLL